MCEPLTIAALTVASTGLAIKGQMDSVKERQRQIDEQIAYNAKAADSALEAQQADYDALLERDAQERERTIDDLQENQIEKLKAQATARVASGEAGISGLSLDALLGDFERQAGKNEQNTTRNFENSRRQTERDLKKVNSTTRSRLNGLRINADLTPVNYGATAIKGATQVASIPGLGNALGFGEGN